MSSDEFRSMRPSKMRLEVLRSRFVQTTTPFCIDKRDGSNCDLGLLETEEFTAAAVLIPIFDRPKATTILLTQRAENLRYHAGQVSFPGGRMEASDSDSVDTALREAEEEIGLMRCNVEVLGRLNTYQTGTGFSIAPIIGLVVGDVRLETNPFEVSDVFEVPINYVLDSRNYQIETAEFSGVRRQFYVLPYEGRRIWGATAGMLVNLSRRLSG